MANLDREMRARSAWAPGAAITGHPIHDRLSATAPGPLPPSFHDLMHRCVGGRSGPAATDRAGLGYREPPHPHSTPPQGRPHLEGHCYPLQRLTKHGEEVGNGLGHLHCLEGLPAYGGLQLTFLLPCQVHRGDNTAGLKAILSVTAPDTAILKRREFH